LSDDQAIFFKSTRGLVVLLGCAHAGVINTLRYVRHLTAGRPIHAVLGGMHLLNFNQLALGLLPAFRQHLREAPDPWDVAVRLAAAGNVMDLGVKSGLDESEIRIALEHCLTEPFDGSPAEFAEAVAAAKRILYLTDNAGEIVFDRLLIEQMPREKVTVAVRGSPVINDATRLDAETAGLTELVPVIDNGSDAPGTTLADCSEPFQRHFAEADLKVEGICH
jgi:uncharacterized protein with ATP-grasp and redox domains